MAEKEEDPHKELRARIMEDVAIAIANKPKDDEPLVLHTGDRSVDWDKWGAMNKLRLWEGINRVLLASP